MDKNSICTVLCAAALFSAASAGPAHAAGLTLGDLQGAWLGQETGCQTYLLRISDSGVETGYYNHCKRE